MIPRSAVQDKLLAQCAITIWASIILTCLWHTFVAYKVVVLDKCRTTNYKCCLCYLTAFFGLQQNTGSACCRYSLPPSPKTLNSNSAIHQLSLALCRYLVALDPTMPAAEMPSLPALPSNAQFATPPNCFEMGAIGWLLHGSGLVNVKDYRWDLQADTRKGDWAAYRKCLTFHLLHTPPVYVQNYCQAMLILPPGIQPIVDKCYA